MDGKGLLSLPLGGEKQSRKRELCGDAGRGDVGDGFQRSLQYVSDKQIGETEKRGREKLTSDYSPPNYHSFSPIAAP